MESVVLYRPVGPEELRLVRESGHRRFPPRLPEQPIFYPVVQYEYAAKIARDWNVRASGAGYVTRFRVDRAYLRGHDEHEAGGPGHSEYWIPAEELGAFNDHFVGVIEVVAEFLPQDWTVVYDLAQDAETIEALQRATRNAADFGIAPDVALFGSDEWWKATRDGRIPVHEVAGRISRVCWTGHGDWPELDVTDGEGRRTSWTRVGRDDAYREGREVRIEYVLQRPRRDGGEHPRVVRVLIRTGEA